MEDEEEDEEDREIDMRASDKKTQQGGFISQVVWSACRYTQAVAAAANYDGSGLEWMNEWAWARRGKAQFSGWPGTLALAPALALAGAVNRPGQQRLILQWGALQGRRGRREGVSE